MEAPEDTPPRPNASDHAYAIVRAGIGAIPFVGGSASELLNQFIAPSLERRRDAWLRGLVDRIIQLEEKGLLDFEKLQGNEAFVTAVLQASRAALMTQDAEKLEALRNAVLHSALEGDPDEAIQSIYLALVERLTPAHIVILRWASQPHRSSSQDPASLRTETLGQAVPQFVGRPQLVGALQRDLDNAGLIEGGTLYEDTHLAESHRPWATDLGRGFLAFISEPEM